jgi:hypothetical protein
MIYRDGEPYLLRRYLFKCRWLTIVLHTFYSSDPDEPHDHPWNWASYVLRGAYYEDSVDHTTAHRKAGSFRFKRAEEFHRIVLDPDCEKAPVTLFFTGARRRKWGFLRGDKWINAADYDRQEVDILGRDFVVEGTFFPRVRWLIDRHEVWSNTLRLMVLMPKYKVEEKRLPKKAPRKKKLTTRKKTGGKKNA